MSYPKNPNTIVLKNKYYPQGLTELNIYKYFLDNRSLILEQIKNRHIMMFIILSGNAIVIKRKLNNKPIILTLSNYNEILHGRCVSIHSIMNKNEKIAIIDIDGDNFRDVKQITHDVFVKISNKTSFIKDCKIRYTGKTGFHIFCYLNKSYDINIIRKVLYALLSSNSNFLNYTIKNKREPGKVNIDLFSNKEGGGFITLGSLSVIGLKCMNVNLKDLSSFNRFKAKI